MKPKDAYAVPLEKLKKVCDYENELNFCNTSLDVSPLDVVVGQDRAVKSMEFGLAMNTDGYHIFVVGPSGTGKNQYTKEAVSRVAAGRPVPDDWCYIHNFINKDNPLAVSLPAGQGREFQQDMDKLIAELRTVIRKAFESSDYDLKRDRIFNDFQLKMGELFQIIEQKAREEGFSVKPVAMKFIFIPLLEGRPMQPEEYNKLTDEQRHEITEKRYSLVNKLDKILLEGQLFEKKTSERLFELDREIAFLTAEPSIRALKEKYRHIPLIADYLDKVLTDVADRHAIFKKSEPFSGRSASPARPDENTPPDSHDANPYEASYFTGQEEANAFTRYKVNLFVNNEKQHGAPVVIEANPYYYNLFGKIEYKSQILVMNTDFTMVKPGAVHLANGGYLVLQAKDLLTDPYVWSALKKILKYRQAVVENIGEQYRTVPTLTLRPEPIPLDVKVILIGSPIFYLILSGDEDFRELFKVKVDFDYEMPRNPENLRKYVSIVSSICHEEGLNHFDRSGLAGIIEYGSRLSGDQNKLSTNFGDVREIVYESITWAKRENSEFATMPHVKKALMERKYRFNNLEEKIQEEILSKKIIIDTDGTAVGQVNGLFVIQTGGYSFGLPARITAITHVGRGGVIDIERETEMSGNIHSKGVFTLAGYLGGKLAQDKPLGFTAQITFEQLYEDVEGDSASSSELFAVISSLAGIELKQGIAVTGSVDQRGAIQPIGGANEKIEGFFDICNATGLTGEQGVMIPSRNIDNLMLKDEVLDAVKNNRFHIYAINNVDEGIELLSGLPAGELGADGTYPEGSVFYNVDQKLQQYNQALGNSSEEPAWITVEEDPPT